MIQLIGEDMLVTTNNGGEHAKVALIAGAEDERGFLIYEPCEPLLEVLVQIQRAVQKATTGAATPILAQRCFRGVEDFWMMRQTKVVVRAYHDLSLATD